MRAHVGELSTRHVRGAASRVRQFRRIRERDVDLGPIARDLRYGKDCACLPFEVRHIAGIAGRHVREYEPPHARANLPALP